jgi:hypothetical protein
VRRVGLLGSIMRWVARDGSRRVGLLVCAQMMKRGFLQGRAANTPNIIMIMIIIIMIMTMAVTTISLICGNGSLPKQGW